jgi:tetratricopeptide (TPR) repeat protein
MRPLFLCTLLIACVIATPSARARLAAPETPAPTEAETATVVSVASPASIAVQEGLAKLRANDVENALLDFQRAIAADLAAPEGHYYLGVAQTRVDRLDRAIESFRTALARADALNDATFGARARVALAMTYARMPNHADDARAAWLEVQTFGEAHGSTQTAAMARSRIAAIDLVRELARTYEPVRHRIAERERPHHGTHGRPR